MKEKNNWLDISKGITILVIVIFAFIGIFVSGEFDPKVKPQTTKSLPNIAIPIWVRVSWTFPFYFTIQSNVMTSIYFILIGFGIINTFKNKHALIFELIVLMNIFITGTLFWFVLAVDNDFFSNWYKLLSNIGLHLIAPILMIIKWWTKTFRIKKQEVFLNIKDIWKFYIFPIIWLIISIIVYYGSRKIVYYIFENTFEDKKLTDKWEVILKSKHLKYQRHGLNIKYLLPGMWGNAIYFFLNFDHSPLWMTLGSIFGITFYIAIISYLLIAFNNNKHAWYIKYIK